MGLTGRVCIVTGASRGIGKEIAKVFAAQGARVVVSARTVSPGSHPLPGSLEETVAEIRAAGGECTPVACDVAAFEDCERLVAQTRSTYGPIDILVNNAALTYFIPVKDFPVDKWHRSLNVNFNAIFYLSKLVLADMIPRKQGRIVNISSPAAIGPGRGPYNKLQQRPGGALYGAEKAAMERFTQGLAAEVWKDNIAVCCFSPSQLVPTPGVVHHKLQGPGVPEESEAVMANACLLFCTEPVEKVSGRVTYSQQILQEFGWQIDPHDPAKCAGGVGVHEGQPGSGYSRM
jgi:NAD(P)-dependent dehydrogenase (short-subunit alcohol dehydrogenase family)